MQIWRNLRLLDVSSVVKERCACQGFFLKGLCSLMGHMFDYGMMHMWSFCTRLVFGFVSLDRDKDAPIASCLSRLEGGVHCQNRTFI